MDHGLRHCGPINNFSGPAELWLPRSPHVPSLWMGAGILNRGRRARPLSHPHTLLLPLHPASGQPGQTAGLSLFLQRVAFAFKDDNPASWPDVLLYGVPHSHDSYGQRQSEKLIHLGFPSSRSSLPSYSLTVRGSCGSTDLGGGLAMGKHAASC